MFQYLGSRGAQPHFWLSSTIRYWFQYLGSRGAQPTTPTGQISRTGFQYLGSRGAQPEYPYNQPKSQQRFNTWAREEPNALPLMFIILLLSVSILGLARSPTRLIISCANLLVRFQYLGSRGAQHSRDSLLATGKRFNTWAREEPNPSHHLTIKNEIVSILGLARSPTRSWALRVMHEAFQYLGSRGAQRYGSRSYFKNRDGFNTWAREEPNLTSSLACCPLALVSILGLARSPTATRRFPSPPAPFQYLGSRGAQPHEGKRDP